MSYLLTKEDIRLTKEDIRRFKIDLIQWIVGTTFVQCAASIIAAIVLR